VHSLTRAVRVQRVDSSVLAHARPATRGAAAASVTCRASSRCAKIRKPLVSTSGAYRWCLMSHGGWMEFGLFDAAWGCPCGLRITASVGARLPSFRRTRRARGQAIQKGGHGKHVQLAPQIPSGVDGEPRFVTKYSRIWVGCGLSMRPDPTHISTLPRSARCYPCYMKRKVVLPISATKNL
jgi:hypothetical protein